MISSQIYYVCCIAIMLLFTLKGKVLLWNRISFVATIRGHLPNFLTLHFVIFILFCVIGLEVWRLSIASN